MPARKVFGCAWCGFVRLLLGFSLAFLILFASPSLRAGGSGFNVVVVANQLSPNSSELANYYRLRRQVPPENVLRIAWPGANVEWAETDFNTYLLNPLLNFLTNQNLTNQVHYVVLSMDIPYRVTGSRPNSTTAALFYGFKYGAKDLTNSYAMSEGRFPDARPATATNHSFLAMMLTAGSLEQAKALVDHGADGDSVFPPTTTWLAKSSDPKRNIRYRAFDGAIFNSRLNTPYSLARTNLDSPMGLTNLLGFQTGLATFGISSNAFVPGAIADSFTSFGGQIFEPSGQTSLLAFIHAGATASYGTITEPQSIVDKFPDPQVYFFQSRGFSVAESYYQGVKIPLEGLLVGEPLGSPYRRQFSGRWVELEDGDGLQGTTNLALAFSANWPGGSIDSVELFIDGKYHQTLTNFPPSPGNRLTVRLNGYRLDYEVPSNASLNGITSALADLLNNPIHTNVTKVIAQPYGDRIELQSLAPLMPDDMYEFVDHDATSNAPRTYLAVLDQPWIQPSVAGLGLNPDGSFRLRLNSSLGTPSTVFASTNLAYWQSVHTNFLGGVQEFVDADAALYSKRFYRTAIPAQSVPPRLTQMGKNQDGAFVLGVIENAGRPYHIQASSDLLAWSDVFTNQLGGPSLFADPQAQANSRRFYRTRSASSNDYSQVTVVGQTANGGNILHVQDVVPGNSIVWASTNSVDWVPIYRHIGNSIVATEVSSQTGSADLLTTSLRSARPDFLKTVACGIRKFTFYTTSSVQPGNYLQLAVTQTNGNTITVSVTNQTGLTGLNPLVQLLVNAVNTQLQLTGSAGLVAEDLLDGIFGSVELNLRARSCGREAAAIQVQLTGSTNLTFSLAGPVALDANVTDLRPRNHLYVSAGLPSVSLKFPLDTTALPDGYHELTAVAYEGSSVHSQTHRSVSVVVSNTPLQAQLVMPAQTNTLATTNVFPVTVTANTNSVGEILLFSTGGLLAGATNQPAATFAVNGSLLGAGEHPFYALVTTTNGLRYRTETRKVTLIRP